MSTTDAMRYLILSIRAACEAALALIDDEETGEQRPPELTASPDPALCEHPHDQRVRIDAMGSEGSWICGVCGFNGSEGVNGNSG
jgi:hypothetical protein